jgi:hypothetical protein
MVIQRKTEAVHERERVLNVLESAGLLLPRDTLLPKPQPVTPEARTELGRKFNEGRPLYELVIEERDDRA